MNEPLNIRISNLKEYESGSDDGVWLKLPIDAGRLESALVKIGVVGEDDPPGGEHGVDYFITGVESPIRAIADLPLENFRRMGIDELNYIAGQLHLMDTVPTNKLIASVGALANGGEPHDLAESLKDNGMFEYLPGVISYAQLGRHYLDGDRVVMPEKWKAAVDVNRLGQIAAAHDEGIFALQGYIVPSAEFRETFAEMPADYRVEPRRVYNAAPSDVNISVREDTKEPVAKETVMDENAKTAIRDPLKETIARLEKGIKDVFAGDGYRDFLDTLSKFHNYSYANCVLIASQNPKASYVAGFDSWQDNFRRHVKKGEKGMRILAPASYKSKREVDKLDSRGKPVLDRNGKNVRENIEVTMPTFKAVSVFDISQTYGEPLPKLGVGELTGSVDRYGDFFDALTKTSAVPVVFEAMDNGAKGHYDPVGKRIAIKEGMGELQIMKTLIHEISHSRLHDIDANATDATKRPDGRTREVEAEGIAYAVCRHYGLDTSEYSFGYIAEWSGDKQIEALKASLGTIRGEANAIIGEIDRHFAELSRDRERETGRTATEAGMETGGKTPKRESKGRALGGATDKVSGKSRGKTPDKSAGAKEKKPSIREQLTEGKKRVAEGRQTDEGRAAPKRAAAKSNALEV